MLDKWPRQDEKSRKQRADRGWADSDVWNLDDYIARVLADSLDHLRKVDHGYPSSMTNKEWKKVLKKMSKGFRVWTDRWEALGEHDEALKALNKSLKLLTKYFPDLWD